MKVDLVFFLFLFIMVDNDSFGISDKDYSEIFDGISNIKLNLEEVI